MEKKKSGLSYEDIRYLLTHVEVISELMSDCISYENRLIYFLRGNSSYCDSDFLKYYAALSQIFITSSMLHSLLDGSELASIQEEKRTIFSALRNEFAHSLTLPSVHHAIRWLESEKRSGEIEGMAYDSSSIRDALCRYRESRIKKAHYKMKMDMCQKRDEPSVIDKINLRVENALKYLSSPFVKNKIFLTSLSLDYTESIFFAVRKCIAKHDLLIKKTEASPEFNKSSTIDDVIDRVHCKINNMKAAIMSNDIYHEPK